MQYSITVLINTNNLYQLSSEGAGTKCAEYDATCAGLEVTPAK